MRLGRHPALDTQNDALLAPYCPTYEFHFHEIVDVEGNTIFSPDRQTMFVGGDALEIRARVSRHCYRSEHKRTAELLPLKQWFEGKNLKIFRSLKVEETFRMAHLTTLAAIEGLARFSRPRPLPTTP